VEKFIDRYSVLYLLLIAALSGIAMFVSGWNSYITGNGKIILSFSFMLIFLSSLILSYLKFIRISSMVSQEAKEFKIPTNDSLPREKSEFKTRETNVDLLKGAFNSVDLKSVAGRILKNLSREFEIVQGVFFGLNTEGKFSFVADYACSFMIPPADFEPGEGISGQAVINHKLLIVPNIPDSYFPVVSGLGTGKAKYLYIIPLIYEKRVIALIEISCFSEIEEGKLSLLNHLMREGGQKLSTVLTHEIK
jgi:hypothetical protein